MSARVQGRLLRGHFLRELLHDDLLAPRGDSQVGLFQVLAVLALPGLVFSYGAVRRYTVVLGSGPAREAALVTDRGFLIGLSMLLLAFVATLRWDALVPGRRDFAVLTPLPIPLPRLLWAKAVAVLAFLSLFAAAVNLVPALVFPLVTAAGTDPWTGTLWPLAAHALSVGGAAGFAGLASMALRGVLAVALGTGASRVAQVLILLFLVQAAFLLPRLGAGLRDRQAEASAWDWAPPAWFVGLNHTLLGTAGEADLRRAGRAGAAGALALAGCVLGYVLAPRGRQAWARDDTGRVGVLGGAGRGCSTALCCGRPRRGRSSGSWPRPCAAASATACAWPPGAPSAWP